MDNSEISALEARIAALEMAQTVNAANDSEVGFHDTSNAIRSETGAFRIDIDPSTRKLKVYDCHFMFGRRVYSISDVPLSGDGLYYLKIPHSQPNGATVVVSSGGANTLDETYLPLFRIQNGEVVADYRGMPCIPAYE